MTERFGSLTRIEKGRVEKVIFNSEFTTFRTFNFKELDSDYYGIVGYIEGLFEEKVEKMEFEGEKNFLVELYNGEVYFFKFIGETLTYYIYDFEKIVEKVGK